MLSVTMLKESNGKDLKEFAKNANAQVLIGYLAGKQHTAGTQAQQNAPAVELAELAKRLSFGDATTPPRPFIEDGLNSKRDDIKKCVKEQIENVKNLRRANWQKVGTMAVGAVQEFVRGDFYKSNVPNSEYTIQQKKSDTPLIDTGDLINSLEFVVEK